jgi:hypothetical protein
MLFPVQAAPIDRANRFVHTAKQTVSGMTPQSKFCDVACDLLPAPASGICKLICPKIPIPLPDFLN